MKRSMKKLLRKVENGNLFDDVPTGVLCQSIQMMIDALNRRGVPVRDFDHKEKHVEQIQILKDAVYFLTKGDDPDGEA